MSMTKGGRKEEGANVVRREINVGRKWEKGGGGDIVVVGEGEQKGIQRRGRTRDM